MNQLLRETKFGFTKFSDDCDCTGGGGGCSASHSQVTTDREWSTSYSAPNPYQNVPKSGFVPNGSNGCTCSRYYFGPGTANPTIVGAPCTRSFTATGGTLELLGGSALTGSDTDIDQSGSLTCDPECECGGASCTTVTTTEGPITTTATENVTVTFRYTYTLTTRIRCTAPPAPSGYPSGTNSTTTQIITGTVTVPGVKTTTTSITTETIDTDCACE
jgi:hypothetical protein